MKILIADTYSLYNNNPRNVRFPKKYKSYKIIWDLREALLAIWQGDITHLAIPKLGTPGYDYPKFIEDMIKIKQIDSKPKVEYYTVNIVSKISS
jgi:hypothetical protein